MPSRRAVLIASAMLVASACGGAASGSSPTVTDNAAPARSAKLVSAAPVAAATPTGNAVLISLAEHYFDPSLVKVKVGTKVTWRNFGQQAHNVQARDNSFSSPMMDPGDTFSFTFTKAGKFPYYCVPHNGDGMFGEVDVE
jgi:plastocyanin